MNCKKYCLAYIILWLHQDCESTILVTFQASTLRVCREMGNGHGMRTLKFACLASILTLGIQVYKYCLHWALIKVCKSYLHWAIWMFRAVLTLRTSQNYPNSGLTK